MNRAAGVLALVALAGGCVTVQAAENGESNNYLRMTGTADWEFFRSEGVADGQSSTYDSFRQLYGVNLAGSIWDYRFNRYLVGLDLYHDERGINGRSADTTALGYRLESTFFPSRPFPLRLFARRTTLSSGGPAWGDSDRETAAWGVEWTLATRNQRRAHVAFDNTSYDLQSPVSLQERRKNGVLEFSQRSRHRETWARYGYSDQRELVRNSRFTRQEFTLSDRTMFDNGIVLLFNGGQTVSDAVYNSGEEDSLVQNRFSTALDLPRRKRVGFSFGYDFNEYSGKFVDSMNHRGRANLSVLMSTNWEALMGVFMGTLESSNQAGPRTQDTTGANLGLRYSRDWSHFELATAYSVGVARTTYDTEPDRTVTNQGVHVNLRFPFGERSSVFASAEIEQNTNDVTGVGYTYDETVARCGFETGVGAGFQGQFSGYRRDIAYDTFEFGLQTSTEYGIEGSVGRGRGSVSMTVSTREGISEFIPDPAASDPFQTGTYLVSSADLLTAGAHWRFRRDLAVRARVRYENREFTSIGHEAILSYEPQLEWTPGVWRLILGVTHYERENGVAFGQDTLLLKASRTFF